MKKYLKLIAAIIAVAMIGGMLSSVVSAAFMGRQATPLAGAVAETPSEYLFEYEGKKFIMLDTEEVAGKKYFFVLCEDTYGSGVFDTSPNRNNDTSLAYWEPEDEYNIAYWLNNDFLQYGNGTGNKLPGGIVEYIDQEREWSTEEMKGLEGYDTAPQLTTHPLALLSATEWLKYYKKIGQNVCPNWFMRSARTNDTGLTNQVLYTGSACALGTNNAWRANGSALRIRPCFYLSEDFFKNCKLTSAGMMVQEEIVNILNKDLYTEEELAACMTAPEAYNVRVVGEFIVGETVTIEYDYSGMYPSNGEEYAWYISDTGSDYTKIEKETGKNLVITEEYADKYITASVVPKCTSPFVKKGSEVISKTSYGPVYGSAALANAFSDIKESDIGNILSKIYDWNILLKVNTDLQELGVGVENEYKFAVILNDMQYESLSEFRTGYYNAAALVRLNLEMNKENIGERLNDEELTIDTSRYDALKDTSSVDDAVYNKDFTSYSTFKATYFKTLAVIDINENDRGSIKELLLYYDEYLDEDLSSLSEYQLEIIATEILKQNYADFEELNNAVSDAGNVSDDVKKPIQQANPGDKDKNEAMGFTNNGIPSIAYRVENALKIEKEDSASIPFTDLEEASWAADSIMYLYDRGIISGYEDGTVKPNKVLLREEFVKMVVDAFTSGTANESADFNDVDQSAWYAPYVNRAVSKGLISGIGDGRFGVGATVTRQDMAVILYRLLEDTAGIETKTFNDNDKIASYAKEAVGKMSAIGLINGYEDGSFNPNAEATRAMTTKVIYDMLVYIGK